MAESVKAAEMQKINAEIKTPEGKSRVSVSSLEVQFLKLSHSIEQNKNLSLIGVTNFFPGEIRGPK